MSTICTFFHLINKKLIPHKPLKKVAFSQENSVISLQSLKFGLKLTMQPIQIIFQGKWPSSPTWQDRQCLLLLFQQAGIFLDQGVNCNLQSLTYSIFRGVLSKNFSEGKLNWSLASKNIHQSALFHPEGPFSAGLRRVCCLSLHLSLCHNLVVLGSQI